jgi:hypothetical protein
MLAARLATALILVALPATTPAVPRASGVTVKMGESMIFALERGRPVKVRAATPTTSPAAGEILVVLRPMFGSTMSVTGNLSAATDYRATLIQADGRGSATRACSLPAGRMTVVENWPKPVAAIRLDRFKAAPAGATCR